MLMIPKSPGRQDRKALRPQIYAVEAIEQCSVLMGLFRLPALQRANVRRDDKKSPAAFCTGDIFLTINRFGRFFAPAFAGGEIAW